VIRVEQVEKVERVEGLFFVSCGGGPEDELHTDDTDETDLHGFVGLNRTLKKGKRDDGD